ncbi:MAG: hypothetical protein ACOCUD_01665 [Bacillota bacterium]
MKMDKHGRIYIGPKMKEVIEKQRQKLKEVAWGIDVGNDEDICEILAEKLIQNKLI